MDKERTTERGTDKKPKIVKTFGNWLQAYLILVHVTCQHQPLKGPEMMVYLNTIYSAYRLHGGSAWWRYDEDFRRRIVRGWKKEKVQTDTRRPITFSLLIRLLEVLEVTCSDEFETLLLRTAFLLAFFAALRIGEMIPASKVKPGGLRSNDVIATEVSIRICIRKSKTDVYGRGMKCGIRPLRKPEDFINSNSRIIGGMDTPIGGQPWTVSIKLYKRHICGGTVVEKNLVVTSAHCVYLTNGDKIQHFMVVAGEYDQNSEDPQQQEIPVSDVRLHPKYKHNGSMSYDIALVYLQRPVILGSRVQCVCLPKVGDKVESGTLCVTSGWGRVNESGELPNILQEVNLPILDDETCRSALDSMGLPTLHKSMICAGFPDGGRDACQGDSGGPLVCRRPSGTWVLVGITSWGSGCGRAWGASMTNRPTLGSPAIFSKVSALIDFIRNSSSDNFVDGTTHKPSIMDTPAPSQGPKHINPGVCGVAPLSPQWLLNRIVAGEESCPNCWPWQVMVMYRNMYQCGGVILSPRWVLTAAHCLQSSDLSRYRLLAGIHDRLLNESSRQDRTVHSIVAHEMYNPINNDYDIALIRLAEDLAFNNFVHPVCLPKREEPLEPTSLCVVTGWGSTGEDGQYSRRLQQLEVPILDNNICNSSYYPGVISERMFCAGFPDSGGKDSCQGDSGGPLVCPSSNKSYILYGIVSWGVGCARSKKPGVYTRVRSFLSWIESTQQEANKTLYSVVRKSMTLKEEGSAAEACPSGLLLDDQVGSIASPGFPYGYVGGLICSWVISTTSSDGLIKIVMEHLSIEDSVNCILESLSLYWEENNVTKLIDKMCGFQFTPVTYESRGPVVRVVFISANQGAYSRNGFSLQYKIYGGQGRDFMEAGWKKSRTWKNCNDVIETSENGVISSPGYPATYPNDLRCKWRIIAPFGSIIRLDIDSLTTEKDRTGCQDILHVYQGLGENKVLLGSFCGNMSDYALKTSITEMALEFTSDSKVSMKGFSSRYSFWKLPTAGCLVPKVLKAGSADLKSPGYPGTYLSGLDCWWIISSVSGNVIELNIMDLSLEDSPNCTWDFLNIYDGASNETKLLLTLCGSKSNHIFSSSSGFLTLHFHTDGSVSGRGFHIHYSEKNSSSIKTWRSADVAVDYENCGTSYVDPMPTFKSTSMAEVVIDEKGTPRVAGGQVAASKSWPWIANLLDQWGKSFCGASIIHKKWLLTAAHCNFVVGSDRAIVGQTDLTKRTEAIVRRSYVHELYSEDLLPPDYDICLLELESPLLLGDSIAVICLPQDIEEFEPDGCLTAGWGATKGRSIFSSKFLQQAKVQLLSREACKRYWGPDITERNLCAGASGASSCLGDSGGPLICRSLNKYKLVGVVSWGSDACDPNAPAVYSSVSKYRNWIEQHTGF
ncbi:ovochymase-1 [Eleutherodactylus coqui]|uniref:ovochymase-1 n=1 Tax=Eleutherodactylus coqui TaxID=57060 RepID=UPI003462AB72